MTNLEANTTGLEEVLAMVNALPEAGGGGGTGGDDGQLDALIGRTITEISNSSVTTIGANAFANCVFLTTANFTACTNIVDSAFISCYKLATVSFPACTAIGSNAFAYCSSLATASFPVCTTIGSSAFVGCAGLTTANFPVCRYIGYYVFRSCYTLSALILRASSVCTLGNSNAFSNASMIQNGTGYIYVPSSLVASYQAATNWTYYSAQISAIEDSEFA